MIIGWDIDGPGHVFGDGVRDYMDSVGHKYAKNYEPPQVWNFFEAWGCTVEEFKEICNAGVDAGFVFRGHVQPGYFEAMRNAKRLGHTNIVITDRFFGTEAYGINPSHLATFEWFEDNGASDLVDEIYFSPDKTIVKTDMFIEDKLENYDALVANGTKATLINRPWNQVPGGDARNRVNSMFEFDAQVRQASRRGYVDLTLA